MEFIKRLANNLFGKRKTYDAKELGIFYSKVWNCWKNESYYWFTSMKFSVYREETFLCINGDSDAPFQPQIFCLREVLNNWEEIRSQISRIRKFLFIGKSAFTRSLSMCLELELME